MEKKYLDKPEDVHILHRCQGCLPYVGYGTAIDICCEEENGELWVNNGEYDSQVNFCPYCGYKAKIQIDLKTRVQ